MSKQSYQLFFLQDDFSKAVGSKGLLQEFKAKQIDAEQLLSRFRRFAGRYAAAKALIMKQGSFPLQQI